MTTPIVYFTPEISPKSLVRIYLMKGTVYTLSKVQNFLVSVVQAFY